jgi:hypothetical protein
VNAYPLITIPLLPTTSLKQIRRNFSNLTIAAAHISNGLLYDKVVLTSESAMILESREAYESFPFRFIVKPADVMQGSGNTDS